MLGRIIAALFLVTATPATVHRAIVASGAVKTYVQQAGVTNGGCVSNCVAATFGAAVGAGNVVVGEMFWNTSSGTDLVTSVTDDKGNTYNLGTRLTDASTGTTYGVQPFWLGNITNGPTIFTAHFSTSTSIGFLALVNEYSGSFALTNPTDGNTGQQQTTPGTGTDAVTSTSITTTIGNDLIWGATVSISGISTAAGTGFTTRGNQGGFIFLEDKNLVSPGATAATFTASAASNYITHVVAIK